MEDLKKKVLIISDQRVGHLNQSIALCKIVGYDFDILNVSFRNKLLKLLGYVFDYFNIVSDKIFKYEKISFDKKYDYIITCGSSTYYAGKFFAQVFKSKLIAIMYPRGFKNSFFRIFANFHDNPKKALNITILPTNISYSIPQEIYTPKKKAIGIVIGGDSSNYKLEEKKLKNILLKIKEQFAEYEIAITSSPRTPKNIEGMIEDMKFDHEVIYSKNKVNPIPDFIFKCEYIFLTDDSTSMISEAVNSGTACVEIISLSFETRGKKFKIFIQNLLYLRILHIYNGRVGKCNKKIDLRDMIKEPLK